MSRPLVPFIQCFEVAEVLLVDGCFPCYRRSTRWSRTSHTRCLVELHWPSKNRQISRRDFCRSRERWRSPSERSLHQTTLLLV